MQILLWKIWHQGIIPCSVVFCVVCKHNCPTGSRPTCGGWSEFSWRAFILCIYILYLILKANSFPSILQVTNGTSISFFRPIGEPPQTHIAPFADNDSEVLKWATETFGGVTSFTTARDPMDTTFTGMKGKITLCIGVVASYCAL